MDGVRWFKSEISRLTARLVLGDACAGRPSDSNFVLGDPPLGGGVDCESDASLLLLDNRWAQAMIRRG